MTAETYQKIPTLYKRDPKTGKVKEEYSAPLYKYLEGLEWVFTEKIDGTNLRIYWDGYNLKFLGRTDDTNWAEAQIEYLNTTFNHEGFKGLIEEKFGSKPLVLFGELFGAVGNCRIMDYGSHYNPNGYGVRFFDVKIAGKYLAYTNARGFITDLGQEFVPEVFRGDLSEGKIQLLKLPSTSVGKPHLIVEGFVAQPLMQIYNEKKERVIVKTRIEDFLFKKQGQDLRIKREGNHD